jgi:hypothetical protein
MADTTPAAVEAQQEPAAVESPNPTYRQKLDAGEHLWMWKLGLRIIMMIVAVIGIGTIGWATSVSVNDSNFSDYFYGIYDYDSSWEIPWGLITVCIPPSKHIINILTHLSIAFSLVHLVRHLRPHPHPPPLPCAPRCCCRSRPHPLARPPWDHSPDRWRCLQH